MRGSLRIGIALLAAGCLASGCVSTSTYDKMKAEKDSEIEALQQYKNAMERRRTFLEQQRIAMEKEHEALKQQIAELERQVNVKSVTVGSLERQKELLVAANQRRQRQYEALLQDLSHEVERGQVQVRQYEDMLSVDLAEQIFFDSGRAALKQGGKDVLKKVAKALKGYDNKIIRVVGHTDNVPVAGSLRRTFPTNWELSVARATTVVRYLQDAGISPGRLVASGRGQYAPLAANSTPDGRRKNRRIEIMLIDESLASELSKQGN